MSPFEALYGRKCRMPLNWSETGGSQVFGPEILKDAEQHVQIIRENLRTAQSRQKSYVDTRRRELEFGVGDYVYLKAKDFLPPLFDGRGSRFYEEDAQLVQEGM